jgi:hypothetical protein
VSSLNKPNRCSITFHFCTFINPKRSGAGGGFRVAEKEGRNEVLHSQTKFKRWIHWDRGFESRSWHVCVSAFVYVELSCVGSGLATGWSPIQGVLPTVQKYIPKFKKSNSESQKARGPNPNLLYYLLYFGRLGILNTMRAKPPPHSHQALAAEQWVQPSQIVSYTDHFELFASNCVNYGYNYNVNPEPMQHAIKT